MRKSARVIVFSKNKKDSIYLIYRKKNGEEYYVLPGGGVENGESFEQAAKREAIEEIGVELANIKQIDKRMFDHGECSLFIADEIHKLEPTGLEMTNTNPSNYYEVQWHNIKDIKNLNLKPECYKNIVELY